MRSVHQDESTRKQELVLDLVVRQGAKKMPAQAFQAKIEATCGPPKANETGADGR